MRICLITPGHIASDPRLVKEAISLKENNYEVSIIFTQNLKFLLSHDIEIIQRCPSLAITLLNLSNSGFFAYLNRTRSKAIGLLLSILFKYFKLGSIEKILNRQYGWQLNNAIRIKADLYIAHNLAALPIAISAAKLNNAKTGFDAEDFHLQEISDDPESNSYKMAKYILGKYLPQVDYCTAASPLIASAYKGLYPDIDFIAINNVFPLRYQPAVPVVTESHALKLFWFSQTIGNNRGLGMVFDVLGRLGQSDIELTLVGNCSADTRTYLDAEISRNNINKAKIKILAPVSEPELFEIIASNDIGLALELSVPYNRDICLTNKIFSYLTGGLAIIATNTKAQQYFMNSHPEIGKSFDAGDIDSFANIVQYYYGNRDALKAARVAAYDLARTELNWELESEKFLCVVKNIL
jgi:glycosyltransferase involved in cell wall biosynthesis